MGIKPEKQKKNPEITFLLPYGSEANPGDVISTGTTEKPSYWTIEEIKENRPAALNGYNFHRANAKHANKY